MKIRIKQAFGDAWYWEIVNRYGRAIGCSQVYYATPSSCRRTVRRLFGPSVKVEVVK